MDTNSVQSFYMTNVRPDVFASWREVSKCLKLSA
jgi:hypothetical protein